MSFPIKKEFNSLIEDIINEVVDHTVPGTAPWYTGFPQEPISSVSSEIFTTYLMNSKKHLEKSLEELSIVIEQLESKNHQAGDLILVRDQIVAAVEKYNQAIEKI